ncbi:Uncharacterized protein Rs2_07148 [Raphanus sativus]|nr:Uncharacterized protein Rs2_07148 [Raphanus sativus]
MRQAFSLLNFVIFVFGWRPSSAGDDYDVGCHCKKTTRLMAMSESDSGCKIPSQFSGQVEGLPSQFSGQVEGLVRLLVAEHEMRWLEASLRIPLRNSSRDRSCSVTVLTPGGGGR